MTILSQLIGTVMANDTHFSSNVAMTAKLDMNVKFQSNLFTIIVHVKSMHM